MVLVDHLLVIFISLCLETFSFAQQWTIESPIIEYRGLQLILDYTISSTLKEDDVSVAMFQDDAFTESLSNENDFLKPSIVVDGSTGTQKVRNKEGSLLQLSWKPTNVLLAYRSDVGYRNI
jgi:hypothetical protein